MSVKKGTEIPTIDVNLVSIQTYGVSDDEIILDTANKIAVTVATETTDKIALIVKGRLIAQKPATTTVTGNTIVLTDNVFNPEVVKILQVVQSLAKVATPEQSPVISRLSLVHRMLVSCSS